MSRQRFSILLIIIISLFASASARAQCPSPQWQAGPIEVGEIDGSILAMTTWDPPGPDPLMLFVGGTFTHIGGINASRIAAWDGTNWRTVGEGRISWVTCLTVHNNMLVAAGSFPGNIAYWDGADWSQPPGGGFQAGPDEGVEVRAMTVFNGELIVAGTFQKAGLLVVNNIVRLASVTSAWQSLGTGINKNLYALQLFDPDGNGPQLFVGTSSSPMSRELRRWNGTEWFEVDSPAGNIYALAVFNGNLIAGGDFTTYNTRGAVSVQKVARWGGSGSSWAPLGGGVGTNSSLEFVSKLQVFGNELIIGGLFDDVEGGPGNNIVRWNGSAYLPMSTGLPGGLLSPIRAMGLFNNEFVVGGGFNLANAVGGPARSIARWNGSNWLSFSPPLMQVNAVTPFAGRIAVGGTLLHTNGPQQSATLRNLVSWDGGSSVSGFGASVNGTVRALRTISHSSPTISSLVVAGSFSEAGGVPRSNVARWDQSSTNPLQTGWSPMGSGLNGTVYALEYGYNGVLVAAGSFTASGGTGLARMARWSTSTNQWQPFATAGGSDMNGPVRAIKVYSVSPTNPLANVVTVAGGDFTSANGQTRLRIAMWADNPIDGATPWTAMGAGFNNTVHAIERHSGSIYAAGAFTADGNHIVQLSRIARWNGSAWVVVGNGVGFNGPVYGLRSHGGFLYAVGDFTSVDGQTALRCARWNGTQWSEVALGLNGIANVITPIQTELFVGGMFNEAGFGASAIESPAAARLVVGAPWIIEQPASLTIPCIFGARFNVTTAEGYDNLAYQWRRNGIPLVDGETGTGSIIFGADGSGLLISYADHDDAASYDCIISNACGSSTSTAATLTVAGGCCPTDLDSSGATDVFDLLILLSNWGSSGPGAAIDSPTTVVDVFDLLGLIAAWGSCP